jgi:subtilase family serine protease
VGGIAKAVVHVELSGPGLASGITVLLRSGDLGGSGVLDVDGVADSRSWTSSSP